MTLYFEELEPSSLLVHKPKFTIDWFSDAYWGPDLVRVRYKESSSIYSYEVDLRYTVPVVHVHCEYIGIIGREFEDDVRQFVILNHKAFKPMHFINKYYQHGNATMWDIHLNKIEKT